MSAGELITKILDVLSGLPDIVFSNSFAVVFSVVFTVGFFVKLIVKVVV